MALPFALDPQTFATLQSTLGPAGALNIAQAQQLEQQKAMQQQATQLSQQAEQAQGQYGQAAAAPVPEVGALDQFLPTLLGGIASVVARDPSFRQHAMDQIAGKRKDLMQARLDNLAALKDTWDKKAAAAAHAGDLQAEQDFRIQSEKIAKLNDTLMENQKQWHAIDLQKLRNEGDLAVEKERTAGQLRVQQDKPAPRIPLADRPIDIKKYIRTSAFGRQYGDIGGITGDAGNAIRMQLRDAGVPVPDAAGAAGVSDISRAGKDLNSLEKDVLALVPRDPQGRILGAFNRKIKTLAQTDPRRAAFKSWSDAAIPVLRATAGSKNLRITQDQVKIILRNLPSQDDTFQTVENKLRILREMLGNAESSLLDADLSGQNTKDPLGIL